MQVKGPVSHLVQEAVNRQCMLGRDFILQGYLTNDWYKGRMKHDSDKATQCLHHLYLGLWRILFGAIWE